VFPAAPALILSCLFLTLLSVLLSLVLAAHCTRRVYVSAYSNMQPGNNLLERSERCVRVRV
jgi:hypothetical protein